MRQPFIPDPIARSLWDIPRVMANHKRQDNPPTTHLPRAGLGLRTNLAAAGRDATAWRPFADRRANLDLSSRAPPALRNPLRPSIPPSIQPSIQSSTPPSIQHSVLRTLSCHAPTFRCSYVGTQSRPYLIQPKGGTGERKVSVLVFLKSVIRTLMGSPHPPSPIPYPLTRAPCPRVPLSTCPLASSARAHILTPYPKLT